MGLYIQGMQIPRNEPLLIKLNPDGSVNTTAKNDYRKYDAVSIPPHGRLIDADAAVANRDTDMNWCYDLYDLPDYLADCPTVIPADPAEEGE